MGMATPCRGTGPVQGGLAGPSGEQLPGGVALGWRQTGAGTGRLSHTALYRPVGGWSRTPTLLSLGFLNSSNRDPGRCG